MCKFSTDLWESVVSRKLSHPKLVKFYGVCSKKYPIYIVTEYITNGCLLNYLKSHGKGLETSQLLEMCYDVCEGMAFLESHQFIHRDLVSKAPGPSEQGRDPESPPPGLGPLGRPATRASPLVLCSLVTCSSTWHFCNKNHNFKIKYLQYRKRRRSHHDLCSCVVVWRKTDKKEKLGTF